MTSIYVGNMPLDWGEEELGALFGEYGDVASVTVLVDPVTQQSRGFGFVGMEPAVAAVAIEALDGQVFEDCLLRVNESRDRGARPPRREY
jgi:cold-inducible RNA-binding protein